MLVNIVLLLNMAVYFGITINVIINRLFLCLFIEDQMGSEEEWLDFMLYVSCFLLCADFNCDVVECLLLVQSNNSIGIYFTVHQLVFNPHHSCD